MVSTGEPALGTESCEGLTGAVGEVLTNSTKHGQAGRITVFLDKDDDGSVLCTVHGDGSGFDPETTEPGMGMTSSLRAPMARVGGSVSIRFTPGKGAGTLRRAGS